MKSIAAVILAAGRGTRMKSDVPKVLHELHSRPMLSFILDTIEKSGIEKKVIVVSAGDKAVNRHFKGLDLVIQKKPLGSGDALKAAQRYFSKFKGDILVLCGDTPLITGDTVAKLVKKHKDEKASCTVLTARTADPKGYGRILRDDADNISRIIEEKDLSIYEEATEEINVGCYCFNKSDLFLSLDRIKMNQLKKEYYLTDIIEILRKQNKRISSVTTEKEFEFLGINSRIDLAIASAILKKKAMESLMLDGVTFTDPASTSVDMGGAIGRDTVIYPNTIIEKDVVIGKGCRIGPFARIRQGTRIADNVEVGNFVELVRTKVSSGTKIKHMTYLGDAEVGENVNIGAGTITANYDGKNKNKTIIENGAFIGVGSIFIAPVKIGRAAVIGAGSVVTRNKNIPAGATVVGIPARILHKRK